MNEIACDGCPARAEHHLCEHCVGDEDKIVAAKDAELTRLRAENAMLRDLNQQNAQVSGRENERLRALHAATLEHIERHADILDRESRELEAEDEQAAYDRQVSANEIRYLLRELRKAGG